MRNRGLVGPTPYETWVRTMKAWAEDPTTPLDHLPPLADDTYTPETYERLLVYVDEARTKVTDAWVQELQRALSRWRTSFELAHDLVQLRASLARRVQLARHPSLPPTVRDVFTREVERAITRYQSELEESVQDSLKRGNLSTNDKEQVLRTIRENSFLRTLDVATTQDGRRQEVAPLPVVQPPAPTASGSRYSHRRLNH